MITIIVELCFILMICVTKWYWTKLKRQKSMPKYNEQWIVVKKFTESVYSQEDSQSYDVPTLLLQSPTGKGTMKKSVNDTVFQQVQLGQYMPVTYGYDPVNDKIIDCSPSATNTLLIVLITTGFMTIIAMFMFLFMLILAPLMIIPAIIVAIISVILIKFFSNLRRKRNNRRGRY